MNTDNKIEPLFLRLSAAANALNMSRSSMYEAVRKGAVPAVRIDGKWRIPRAFIEKLATDAMKTSEGE